LVASVNADGSHHSFHDGGIEWKFTETISGARTAEHTLSLLGGPSIDEFALAGGGPFASFMPATVWDTVFNNTNEPVDWSPGIWTRDEREIGRTFPDGIIQFGENPPEMDWDHIDLPETPNDFHFDAFLPFEESVVSVWAFWDTTKDADFGFGFDMFTVPGVQHLDVAYELAQGFIFVQDVTNPSNPNPLFQGSLEEFDPALIDIGLGPGQFRGQQRLAEAHVGMFPEFELPGDFDGDGIVGADDLNLVLFNWNSPSTLLPPEWLNQRPPTVQGGAHSDALVANVGADQLNLILFNWNSSIDIGFEQPIPEPTSSVLFIMAIISFVATRQRRV